MDLNKNMNRRFIHIIQNRTDQCKIFNKGRTVERATSLPLLDIFQLYYSGIDRMKNKENERIFTHRIFGIGYKLFTQMRCNMCNQSVWFN